MNHTQQAGFNFWNDHSLEFLEMAMKRDYQETVARFDGYGRKERDCGDTIEIFLGITNGMIETISYDIKGCLYSHACTNTLIKLASGRSVEDAKLIDAGQIVDYLKTLPSQEEHCAAHALAAFQLALADYAGKTGQGI